MTTHQLVRGLGGVLLWLVAVPPAAARAAPQSKEFQAARGSHVITLPARAVRVQGGDHNVEFVASGYEHARRVVKGAPYSAESVTATVQALADGNRIVREHNARVCRDSEGRTRREQTLNSIGPWASEGHPRTIIFIHDPVCQGRSKTRPLRRRESRPVQGWWKL